MCFKWNVVGYFSPSIYFASSSELFSNEYEIVLHFGRNRKGEEWEMMNYKDGDDFESKELT